MNLITLLQGKKTYIVAITGSVVIALTLMGYIPNNIANDILIFLFPAGLVTLKAGQTRIENKIDDVAAGIQ